MLVVTAALSVSEQIKDVGAYAGLASILGLAVLSLLYFGQARELKRLRDWAGRAPERTAELQEQANAAAAAQAAQPQRRVVAQPAAAAPAVRSPAQTPATAAGVAARPAGSVVAGTAPAAGAGTAGVLAGAPAAAGAGAAGTAAAAAGAAGAAGAPATTPAAPGNGTPPPATSVGQETQAIQAVDGGTELPPAVPSVVAPTPIGPEGPPTDDSPVPLRQISGSSVQPRRRAGAEAAAPVTVEPSSNRPRGRTLGMIAGAVAALLLVVVLATQLGGGDDPSPAAGAGTATTSTDNEFVPPPTGPTSPTTPPVEPGDYAVYVLNGTLQNGIAAEVAKTLETDGYRSAGTGNAAVNTATTTEIFYLEGKKRGASAVARKLGVAAANVKAAPREVSVQGPGADVIVQIGADKATP